MLKVGYAQRDVTPPLGVKIPGQQKIRIAEGIITPLMLRAVALDDGNKRGILFMCDAVKIFNEAYYDLSKILIEECGVDPDCIWIHATHSHTAMWIAPPSEYKGKDQELARYLYLQFKDCANDAFNNLSNAEIKTAAGIAEGVGFLRRYEMKDGTFKTNPTPGDANILRPAGTMDNSVQLIRIIRENNKEILIVNYGTHPDTIGGKRFCWDWPGYVVKQLKSCFQNEVEVIHLNGCQGNAAARNRLIADDGLPKKSLLRSKKMARILAGEVLKIYDSAEDVSAPFLSGAKLFATVGINEHKPEEVPLAKEIVELYMRLGDRSAPEVKEITQKHGISVTRAARIVKNAKGIDHFDIPVYGLRLGKIVFIGFPGEPFTEIGIEVKKHSSADFTVCSCCTNGAYGYFPTKEAFDAQGYERDSSRFSPNVAKALETTALTLIETLMKKDQ